MNDWLMLTLIGEDRPGIVARVTETLYRAGWTLGEASMMRLGGNFAVMMMVRGGEADNLEALLEPVTDALGLRLHLDAIAGGLHRHVIPNYQLRVTGADRAGIVAQVTGALAEAGFNILELESDVAGDEANPVYIMTIQGYSDRPLEVLQKALEEAGGEDVEVSISPIDTLIG